MLRSTEAGEQAAPAAAPTGTALGPGDRAAPVGRVGALSGVDSAAWPLLELAGSLHVNPSALNRLCRAQDFGSVR